MTMANKITSGKALCAGTTGLCEGTNLRTPCGPRRVEFVREGDLIVTRDNGLQPVRLVWSQTVTKSEMAADPSLAPVLMKPRALGPMMPKTELRIGGAHQMLVPGWRLEDEDDTESCLVPVRDVDGLSLGTEAELDDVTYFNVVFENSQIFCANGLPVESFVATESSLANVPQTVRDKLKTLVDGSDPKSDELITPKYKQRKRVSYTPDFV